MSMKVTNIKTIFFSDKCNIHNTLNEIRFSKLCQCIILFFLLYFRNKFLIIIIIKAYQLLDSLLQFIPLMTSSVHTQLMKVCTYQPLCMSRMWLKVNFSSEVKQVWIQSFPTPRLVAIPRLKSLICLTILPTARVRIVRFIVFPRVFVLYEIQTASSWI